jgi:hypothetical protein
MSRLVRIGKKMIELSGYNFDHRELSLKFFAIALCTVIGGLILGGIIDSVTRKLQNDGEWNKRQYLKSMRYFIFQASFNILILLLFTKSTVYFIPWFQLSVSGALFAVLLFAAQRNLTDNALRLTNF